MLFKIAHYALCATYTHTHTHREEAHKKCLAIAHMKGTTECRKKRSYVGIAAITKYTIKGKKSSGKRRKKNNIRNGSLKIKLLFVHIVHILFSINSVHQLCIIHIFQSSKRVLIMHRAIDNSMVYLLWCIIRRRWWWWWGKE